VVAPSSLPVASGFQAIAALPDGASVAVVNLGDGYVINAKNAADWNRVPVRGITRTLVSVQDQMVVFAGLTDLAAYGPSGLQWATEHLSWDGLRELVIRDRTVSGDLWDAPGSEWKKFRLNLATGKPV
jgi:hypothetical protein